MPNEQVTLQLEFQSKWLDYGRSTNHPYQTGTFFDRIDGKGIRIYPTSEQCECFALRIEKLIRNHSKYFNLANVMLLIDLDNGSHYITHTLAYPGQFDGDAVYEANRRFIAHEYADTGIILGGIAYMPLTTETIELIAGLDSYPVFDDEYVSEVELELEDEAWHDWVRRDIAKAIEYAVGDNYDEVTTITDDWDNLPDDVAYQFYRDAMEATNTYFESNHVDVDRISDHIIAALLEESELLAANFEVCGVQA